MSFSQDAGYLPQSISEMMSAIRLNINTQFSTSYDAETFEGTNFYKFFYALLQRVQENETKTAEIFLKLQDYFSVTNERILRPVATAPGVIAALAVAGFTASVKPMILADAGKIYICVVADSAAPGYAVTKQAIAAVIRDSVVAGVSTQGAEVVTFVLSNGQSFNFSFKLPNRITPLVRLTTTLSLNNREIIGSPESVKAKLLLNIGLRYHLGNNFEPQKYFTIDDAPWTSKVLLEYSLDGGGTWLNTIYTANYDDLFVINLANITVVES